MAREVHRAMKRVPSSDIEDEVPRDRGKGRANGVNGDAIAGPSNSNGGADGEDEGGGDYEEPGWTIEDYEPRGIMGDNRSAELFRKVNQRLSELEKSLKDSIAKSTEMAVEIEKIRPGSRMIDEIDEGVRKALDQLKYLEIRAQVIESLDGRLNRGQIIQYPLEQYGQEVKVKVDEWNNFSERAKFRDNEDYRDFRALIWAVENGNDSECPPVTRWLDAGDNEEENSDDDIEMGGRTQTFRCPLTLKIYEHAVTSRKCKHSYSQYAILGMLKKASRKGPAGAKCPVAGCKAHITKEDLVDDPKLQKKADEFALRQATQTQADVSMAVSVAGDDDEDEDDD